MSRLHLCHHGYDARAFAVDAKARTASWQAGRLGVEILVTEQVLVSSFV
jgi:hypothetical protein